ncbi:MAG TPA: nuclear transport factor 2 family protein [Pyrinomonadaceae bacterium]|nr:nuclear transport factor 2 family protein [Pyrinomonadaceae bacterium]
MAANGAAAQGAGGQQPRSTADAWKQALPQHEEPDPSAAVTNDIRRGSPEERREEIEKRLSELEQHWMGAIRAGDADSLRRILAADFAHAGGDGEGDSLILGKAEYVAHTLREPKLGSHAIDRLRVRVYEDTAVVSGLYRQGEPAAPGTAAGDFVFTDVWVKKAGVWRAVSRHLSRVPDGPAAKD